MNTPNVVETVIPAQTQTADVTSPIVTDGPQVTVSSPVVESAQSQAASVDANAPIEPTTTVPTDEDAPKVTPKWAQDRINELTAKRYAEERRASAAEDRARVAEELLAKVGTQPNQQSAPKANEPAPTEQEIERRAQQLASQMAQQQVFNDTCNRIADAGAKEFKDWKEALGNLTMVGAIGDGTTPDFLETAIELKSPQKVLHYLGTNLDEAKRITEMPPKKMALEMARLEAALNAPPQAAPLPPVSNAPAPIIPVAGAVKAGAPDINDPNLSPEEWFAARAKQIAEKRNRYLRA